MWETLKTGFLRRGSDIKPEGQSSITMVLTYKSIDFCRPVTVYRIGLLKDHTILSKRHRRWHECLLLEETKYLGYYPAKNRQVRVPTTAIQALSL